MVLNFCFIGAVCNDLITDFLMVEPLAEGSVNIKILKMYYLEQAHNLLVFTYYHYCFGKGGYVIFEGMSLFEAFYMTLSTISTVGFSEVRPLSDTGCIITIIIIVLGISLLTYTLKQVARIFIEGELRKILGRRKLEKQIAALKDLHIIEEVDLQIEEALIKEGSSVEGTSVMGIRFG